ncbi:Uncharacterised protein [Bordetella holmesii]|nr:Uncharacterised protein [Bordetella holmesii]
MHGLSCRRRIVPGIMMLKLNSSPVSCALGVAAFALLAAALHVLLVLWAGSRMGAAPAGWVWRLALGVLMLSVGALALGEYRREHLMGGLRQDLETRVQRVCREAEGIVRRLVGHPPSHAPVVRARVEKAVRSYFKDVVREHFSHTRYSPVEVLSAGKKNTGDFVLELKEQDRERVRLGCYNQYQQAGSDALPEWRHAQGRLPAGSMVFFVQERQGGKTVVDYPGAEGF